MLDSRRCRRNWWIEGLLLVLVLLGHDVLMASEADGAPLSSPASVAHGHAPTHQPAIVVAADRGEEQHPTHPTACGVVGTAVPSSGYQLDVGDLEVLRNDASPDPSEATLSSVQRWDEPFWPPGTRRALFQVYRN